MSNMSYEFDESIEMSHYLLTRDMKIFSHHMH